jgi:hypothetical protein
MRTSAREARARKIERDAGDFKSTDMEVLFLVRASVVGGGESVVE